MKSKTIPLMYKNIYCSLLFFTLLSTLLSVSGSCRTNDSGFPVISLLIPHSLSPIPCHSSPRFLHSSVWHVRTPAMMVSDALRSRPLSLPLTLSLLLSLSLPLALSSCLPHSFAYPFFCFSSSVSLSRFFRIYVIPCIFSTLRTIHPHPISPLPTLFSRNFRIPDGPLPSFHCCLFPLHTALFSAAVQIQARTGHN